MIDNSEYIPIHPNITDVSMIDIDTPIVDKRKKQSNIDVNIDTESNNIYIPSIGDKKKQHILQQSWQRNIIIGIVTVIVIILCIMLLYQLYKYYTTEVETEQTLDKVPSKDSKPLQEKKITPIETSIDDIHIPDNISTLDSDFLNKYVKKPVEAKTYIDSSNTSTIDMLVEEHNSEMDTAIIEEVIDIKIEENTDTPIRELNTCTFTIKKRGKKNTTCGRPCIEELCDDHKS